jgi:CRP-like cAMP-binding protein
MSKRLIYDYIKEHPLFEGVREESLAVLSKAARVRPYPRNGIVFDTSHRNTRHFFIIMEGRLQLNLQNLKKKKMMPGGVFGEVAFFSNDHRTGSVTALEKSKLLAFPRSIFAGASLKLYRQNTNRTNGVSLNDRVKRHLCG